MEFVDAVMKIFFVATVASLPVYVLVLYVLWKYRKTEFKSSFFTLSLSLGTADLLYTAHKYILHHGMRWFAAEWAKQTVWLPTIYNMGSWGLFYVQMFGILLIAINRYTALVMPLTYHHVWSRKLKFTLIGLQWGLPAAFSLTMLHPKCRSHYVNDMEEAVADPEMNKIYWYFDVILEAGLVAPTVAVLYFVMFCKLRKQSREVRDCSGVPDETEPKTTGKCRIVKEIQAKVEYRLAITGLIVTSLYIVQVSTFVMWAIGWTDAFIDYIFYFASDLFTGINPYLLIVFSESIRDCVKVELQKFKCFSSNSTAFVTEP